MGTHGLPTSPTSKRPFFKAGPGGAGLGSVPILAQVCLPQGWQTGMGFMSPSLFAGNGYRWRHLLLKL